MGCQRTAAFFWFSVTVGSAAAYGQVIANPNQISGAIRLTNTNPAILAVINPLRQLATFADQVGSGVLVTGAGPRLYPDVFARAGAPEGPSAATLARVVAEERTSKPLCSSSSAKPRCRLRALACSRSAAPTSRRG